MKLSLLIKEKTEFCIKYQRVLWNTWGRYDEAPSYHDLPGIIQIKSLSERQTYFSPSKVEMLDRELPIDRSRVIKIRDLLFIGCQLHGQVSGKTYSLRHKVKIIAPMVSDRQYLSIIKQLNKKAPNG